jgi:outer membrane protein assembly factor BamD
MIFLRNLIAKQEIYIAEYYIERKAYVAAINRANYIIQHMSKTPEVLKALEISIIAYNELGKEDLAQEAEEVLKAYKEKI